MKGTEDCNCDLDKMVVTISACAVNRALHILYECDDIVHEEELHEIRLAFEEAMSNAKEVVT